MDLSFGMSGAGEGGVCRRSGSGEAGGVIRIIGVRMGCDASGSRGWDLSEVVHDGESSANAKPGTVYRGVMVGIGGMVWACVAGATALTKGDARLGG